MATAAALLTTMRRPPLRGRQTGGLQSRVAFATFWWRRFYCNTVCTLTNETVTSRGLNDILPQGPPTAKRSHEKRGNSGTFSISPTFVGNIAVGTPTRTMGHTVLITLDSRIKKHKKKYDSKAINLSPSHLTPTLSCWRTRVSSFRGRRCLSPPGPSFGKHLTNAASRSGTVAPRSSTRNLSPTSRPAHPRRVEGGVKQERSRACR